MKSLIPLVKDLAAFGERQGPAAARAGRYLMRELRAHKIPFAVEPITTFIPRGTSRLIADGAEIPSAPTSMVSGTILNKDGLSSSLIRSRYLIDVPNINFNPSSCGLSVSNLYFAPALAVRTQDIPKILKARNIRGEVKVRKTRITLPQILVGNVTNPKVIVFCHYDSIGGPGAIDNASGTAVCLSLCGTRPNLLKEALFVFDPNEEASYDYPTYWGHGYRVFAKRYGRLMKKARRILIIDSVGNGKPKEERKPEIINLAFPVPGLSELRADVVTIEGDIDGMMKVYQSELDMPELLSESDMAAAYNLAEKLIEEKICPKA